MRAGNLLAAWEAIDAGATTVVDWSGLPSVDHAEAAVDGNLQYARSVRARVREHPGRAVGVDRPAGGPAVPHDLRDADDRLGVQLAFDVTGDPAFPEKAAFEVARELGLPVTTHAGVWGATNDDGIRLMHENGFMTPGTTYVHAATLETDFVPADRGHRRHRLGGDRVRAERGPGAAHVAGAPVRHTRLAVDGHQRLVERGPSSRDADDARRGPGPRAPRGPRRWRDRHRVAPASRARRRLGDPRRRGTSAATTSAGTPAPRPTSQDHSPVSFPLLNLYGHVAFQAQRATSTPSSSTASS